MTPEQIARGFLLAQLDPDHTAALSYLSPEEARCWNPDARVVIFANERVPAFVCGDVGGLDKDCSHWKVLAAQQGVISDRGDFTATPPARRRKRSARSR